MSEFKVSSGPDVTHAAVLFAQELMVDDIFLSFTFRRKSWKILNDLLAACEFTKVDWAADGSGFTYKFDLSPDFVGLVLTEARRCIEQSSSMAPFKTRAAHHDVITELLMARYDLLDKKRAAEEGSKS